jgi:hypothetical protein
MKASDLIKRCSNTCEQRVVHMCARKNPRRSPAGVLQALSWSMRPLATAAEQLDQEKEHVQEIEVEA